MSLSVESTSSVRVRQDDAEMSLSVELTSDVRVAKVPQEAELRPSVEMNVKIRECSESGPPPTHTPAQEYPKIHLQSMTPSFEKSCCCRSNSDWPNGPVGGELRYLCTSVHRGTTLCNMEPCSRLKKHMKVNTEPPTPHPIPNAQPSKTTKTPPPTPPQVQAIELLKVYPPPQMVLYRTVSM